MKKSNTLFLTKAALIAALYVILTAVSAMFSLDKGAIQLRLSEILTVLPIFTLSAVPGLTIGCILANMLFGAIPLDTLFGSIATLIGALGTYFIGKKHLYLSPLPPVISNAIIVPLVLKYAYGINGSVPYFALTVFIGEFICCYVFGLMLVKALPESFTQKLR